jgi:hypothetical protein
MADDKAARRKALEAELAALDQDDDEAEYEYEVGWGDKYWRGSSKSAVGQKIRAFFEGSGIDLSEPEPEEPDEPAKDEPKRKAPAGKGQQGGNVRAFRGRGVG